MELDFASGIIVGVVATLAVCSRLQVRHEAGSRLGRLLRRIAERLPKRRKKRRRKAEYAQAFAAPGA